MTEEEVGLVYEYLHANYEYRDGELIRKISKCSAKSGDRLGSLSFREGLRPKMLCMLYIKGVSFKKPLANLIYLFHHKTYPYLLKFLDENITNMRIDNIEQIYSKEIDCKGYGLKKENTISKYRAMVQNKNRKQISLGTYKTIEECKEVYNFARNLQKQGIDEEIIIKQKILEVFPNSRIRIHKHKNKFIGVSDVRGRFLSKISINGKQSYLGSYDSEIIAHEVYKHAQKLKTDDFSFEEIISSIKEKFTSKSLGNSKGYYKKGNKYQAILRKQNLGTYDTPEEANAAYLKAKEEHQNL